MPALRISEPEQATGPTSRPKVDVTSKPPVGGISVVTLVRTDTTLDHCQKAEKVCWSIFGAMGPRKLASSSSVSDAKPGRHLSKTHHCEVDASSGRHLSDHGDEKRYYTSSWPKTQQHQQHTP